MINISAAPLKRAVNPAHAILLHTGLFLAARGLLSGRNSHRPHQIKHKTIDIKSVGELRHA